ncbi:MAG: aminotransferase class V-fold PLP-dependent enzyme, partial [Thermocrispum sp.]
MHYLDHACFSPPAADTIRAVRDAATALTQVGDAGATQLALDWMQCRSRARESVATLLGCSVDDVTLVENTTHGLGIVAGGLKLAAGDNVVVADCDFIGVPTVWRTHQRAGVELRAANSDHGRLSLDALLQTVDERTRVICISAIQEVSGWPVDLDGAADIAESV